MTPQTQNLLDSNALNENRKLKRYSCRLKVFTQASGVLLGYAENLHTQGMKLKSQAPIPEKEELEIWFGASANDDKEKRIRLTAYRVWSSFNDTIPRFYFSGLHFVKPSEEALDSIEELIDELTQ